MVASRSFDSHPSRSEIEPSRTRRGRAGGGGAARRSGWRGLSWLYSSIF